MRIPEIPLELKPKSAEAEKVIGFKWAGPEVGKRSKLGGKPHWEQGSEVPRCSCGNEMTFCGQVDSIGDEINLADCGRVYVFVCFDCSETKSILQS